MFIKTAISKITHKTEQQKQNNRQRQYFFPDGFQPQTLHQYRCQYCGFRGCWNAQKTPTSRTFMKTLVFTLCLMCFLPWVMSKWQKITLTCANCKKINEVIPPN